MKKMIIIGTIALGIAIGVGAYYLVSNLSSLVASAIEKHGSDVTQTSVGVSGVKISLREGRGSITDLRIASPEGFKTRNVFALADITIDLDLASVRENPIVIDEIRIRAPVINAEVLKNGNSNIDELRKRVQAYSGAKAESADGVQKKLRIKKFVFEQGRVEVDASALGVGKRTLTLPEIRLDNVGGEKGVPPDQIAKLILTTVAKKTASEIASSEVNRLIKEQLGESISEKAKGLLGKIGN